MHIPVLLNEIKELLPIEAGEVAVDATTGGGGHTEMLCQKVGKEGTVVAIDADSGNLSRAKEHLGSCPARTVFIQDNFRNIDKALAEAGFKSMDVLLFDLGLSSMQLEDSGRGFTFQKDEPLAMTFGDGDEEITAHTVVNEWKEETLADILYGFGDERFARRIAKGIVDSRKELPIETTHALVSIIKKSVPGWYQNRKTHPATKTFQAIRMAVNDELGALQEALEKTTTLLSEGGRIAVISYHSGEDRVVKQFFKQQKTQGVFHILTKKPVAPTNDEIRNNPKARSAKLRIAQKVTT